MAVLADRNVGFAGQIKSDAWAKIAGRGSRYSIEGAADFKVTAGPGARELSVTGGTAWGDGVRSTWDTGATLTAPEVLSGSRWDTVVARRTWQPGSTPTGKAELVLLQGGTTQAIAASRTTDAGVTTSDQPLWLARFDAGKTAVQQLIDLRVWAGQGGTLLADHQAALAYLEEWGTHATVKGAQWVRRSFTPDGPETWTPVYLGGGHRRAKGQWHQTSVVFTGGVTNLTAEAGYGGDRLYCLPLITDDPLHITAIGEARPAGNSATVRYGIYSVHPDTYLPHELLADSGAVTTAASPMQGAVDVTLPPGGYWVCRVAKLYGAHMAYSVASAVDKANWLGATSLAAPSTTEFGAVMFAGSVPGTTYNGTNPLPAIADTAGRATPGAKIALQVYVATS